ncbi:putative ATP-grasp superfamily ATP-dependent carboligase [Actinomycetospora succinea]|uniref:Putative ATP-grasp superfamily ATP-dependent carboligase n=1 Tax=Actinomycetospora succinea TaxID=663603 RepID=A0A4R6VH55_9PSEU|nr:ATP-grasp enzyme [Actinomycetospora succinea]TDQ62547.1 putative ATP-grasp superfamily ATP-dependent carboligase [Actinomycetospora succinea]
MNRLKTLGALALLTVPLPVTLAVTAAALVRSVVVPARRAEAVQPRTVLVTGGKMTKALALARAFHTAGHRVVLVESAKYRFTGHRFSRAVDAFHVIPEPGAPGYVDALRDVVVAEGVDVWVPVCSPAASRYDALAKPVIAEFCEVLHPDPQVLRILDDKDRFAEAADTLGLPVPETHRVTAPAQVEDFDFDARPGPWILKSVPYDPVARLDLTTLPRPTRAQTAELARAKPMSDEAPWILQAFTPGREYCTHATVREGRVQVWACCESSAFQLNYAMVDKPEIEEWVRRFVGALRVTGQVSFDFIETPDGSLVALECNPRTHSAITMFHRDAHALARAYLEDVDGPPLTPSADSRPTYWLYQELWRLVSRPASVRERLRVLRAGTDAVFDRDDPLPFLLLHHLQIPSLLLRALVTGKPWIRVDVNIGKLVEPAGD